ncbi:MAG: alternative ribosome rescue aminoacyl-tRNA hydrolase ArfB [Janthinobacterium lividum]
MCSKDWPAGSLVHNREPLSFGRELLGLHAKCNFLQQPRQLLPLIAAMRSLIKIPDHEYEIHAIRAQGAGGQNVNKLSTAVHLRFDIHGSSLPELVKTRLLTLADRRITEEGVIVVKAQTHRSQGLNRIEAVERLHEIVNRAAIVPRARRATQPTRASKQRRLADKAKRADTKAGRTGRFD